MGSAEEVLVIFLSVALAVFLTLGIVFVAFCIKIAAQVSRMTDKAEAVVEKAGEVIEQVHNTTALAMASRVFSHIFKSMFGKHKPSDKEDEV